MNKSYKSGVGFLVLLPLALTFGVSPVHAQVIPAADGTGSLVNQNGNQLGITGGQVSGDGANLFHSFDRFGLSQGQVADFLASPVIRNIFGRVVGGETSAIDGLLRVSGSNANLFLMNPAGILFGPNARLDLPAAFTATTANGIGFGGGWFSASGVNDYGRLLGSPEALSFVMPQSGAIANFGNLTVGEGQSLSLMGGAVLNGGTLKAPSGHVTISAITGTQMARITPTGSLLSLEVPLARSQPQKWNLPVSALPQLLTGGEIGDANGVKVEPDGAIRLVTSGKKVTDEPGTVIVSGTVDTSNIGIGKVGGMVTVTGDRVGLVSATVDASGNAGGGNVRIGGEFQGMGEIPNASRTYVSNDSQVRVNALEKGNGGRAIFWSDNSISFSGRVESRGIGQNGNGGFVEISGRENLSFSGQVDLDSSLGKTGQVLFDPQDINIVPGIGIQDGEIADQEILRNDGGSVGFQIGGASLVEINGDIALEASQNINLTTDLFFPAPTQKASQPPRTIEFIANGQFIGGKQSITAPSQNIKIIARGINTLSDKSPDISLGAIDTVPERLRSGKAGNIFLEANNKIDISGREYDISVTSDDPKSVLVSLRALSNQSEKSGQPNQGGDIDVISNRGDIILSGLVQSFARSADSLTDSGGNITIKASRGRVETGTIFSFSQSQQESSGSGGNVAITADKSILIKTNDPDQVPGAGIVTLSQSSKQSSGNSGNITLTAGGDITTGYLNSSNSAVQQSGKAGNITINATGFLRVTDKNLNAPCLGASICTVGGSDGGNVIIAHIAGLQNIPFIVGDATINGTVGDIQTRLEKIGSLSLPGSYISPLKSLQIKTPTPELIPNPCSLSPSQCNPPSLPSPSETPDRESPTKAQTPSTKEDLVNILEDIFTKEAEAALGIEPPVTRKTATDIKNELCEADQLTGRKSARIFAFFEPNELRIDQKEIDILSSLDRVIKNLALRTNRLPGKNDLLNLVLITCQGGVDYPVTVPSAYFRKKINSLSVMANSKVIQIKELRDGVADQAEDFSEITFHKKENECSKDKQCKDRQLASSLYNVIIKPIEQQLKTLKINTLVFSLDAKIASIPISALYDSQDNLYLFEKYRFSIIPSSSLTISKLPHQKDLDGFLGVGASRTPISNLEIPFVITELTELEKIWKINSQKVLILPNKRFTEQSLQRALESRQYKVVHVASHARFKPDNEGGERIETGGNPIRSTKWRELGFGKAPVELLVLAACETALGNREAELGFSGLATTTGAKSVIGSLSDIEDPGVAAFMLVFYNFLLNGKYSKIDALIQTQLSFKEKKVYFEKIRQKEYLKWKTPNGIRSIEIPQSKLIGKDQSIYYFDDPYYWSGFTLVGNPW